MFNIGVHVFIVKSSQLTPLWLMVSCQSTNEMKWEANSFPSCLFTFLLPVSAFNDEILEYLYPIGCVYLEREEGNCAFACAEALVS